MIKLQIKEHAKAWLAAFLTLAIVLQLFAGIDFRTKAADTDNGYTEMTFSDWGNSEGTKHGVGVYSLTDTAAITDLNGVAITGKVNFNGNAEARLNFGATTTTPNGGLSLHTSNEHLVISNEGIGANGYTTLLTPEKWEPLLSEKFTLRMEFDKDADSNWTVKVYIDGTLVGTHHAGAITPELYLGSKYVTAEGLGGKTYKELTFGDWGVLDKMVYFVNAYRLTDADAITSLAGTALTGTVNFNGDSNALFTIGGYKTDTVEWRHGGIYFRTTAGQLTINPEGVNTGGYTTRQVIVGAEEWSTLISQDFILRIEFSVADGGDWTANVYVNGVLKGSYNIGAVTTGLTISNSVANPVTIRGLGEVKYKEMTFGDWGVSAGERYGTNTYSLTDAGAITSLHKVAVSGKVNFNGDKSAYFRIGGYKTNSSDARHVGISIRTKSDTGALILWPEGLGGNTSQQIILSKAEWEPLMNTDITLRLGFVYNAVAGTWSVNVFINGTSKGTYDCGAITPGLYIANCVTNPVTIDGLGVIQYQEMNFSDWESAGTVYTIPIYSLKDTDSIDSLHQVAVTGKVNFHGDTTAYIRVGGFKGTNLERRHAGVSITTNAAGALVIWPQDIIVAETTDGEVTKTESGSAQEILSADEWANLIGQEFTLRMEFFENSTTTEWNVGVYINEVLKGTYNCGKIVPGLYIADSGVSIEGMASRYKEMTFGDWGVDEGNVWGVMHAYSLTDPSVISDLHRVAISGKVNFDGDTSAKFAIGGYEKNDAGSDRRHAGLWISTDAAGKLIMKAESVGEGTGIIPVLVTADEWATLIKDEVDIRFEFDKKTVADSGTEWYVKPYINGEFIGSFNFGTITPGLYISNSISKPVKIPGLGEIKYTELSFADWKINEGMRHTMHTYNLYGYDEITSLAGVAVTGKVNFNGDADAQFAMGGYKNGTTDNRHVGIYFRTSGAGQLVLKPEAIGGNATAQVIVAADEWATLINQEFTLRVELRENANTEWIAKVYVNGTLKGTYNLGTITIGCYISVKETGVANPVTIEGLGEVKFSDLNVPDMFNPPTEMGGETEVGKYITAVETSGDTTVISAADTDNGFESTTDFSNYNLDYVMDFNVDRDLKVLQLTDTQSVDSSQIRYEGRITWEVAEWKPEEMYNNLFRYIIKTVRDAQPDLILITGDVIYGEFDDNGVCLTALIDCMDSLKIPWAPIFGNHDNESSMGVRWQCEQFEKSPYCLFTRRNEIGGNGNYSIGLAKNGAMKRVIYMMDNNGCANSSVFNGAEVIKTFGFTAAQQAWYEEVASNVNTVAGKTIPSFLCYHAASIDFEEGLAAAGYSTDRTVAYTIGEDVAALQTGDNGTKGKGQNYQSGMEGSKMISRTVMKAVGTDGVFVGHEHLHNFSIAYDGIRWTYGLKTGTYDNHPDELGGTLITLASDSDEFTVTQVKTSKEDMNKQYLTWDFPIENVELDANPNYIFWDKGISNTGYTIPATAANATIADAAYNEKGVIYKIGDDVAYNTEDVHTAIGVSLLEYLEDGLEMIKKLVVYIKGDANCDDSISAIDIVRMKQQTKETDAIVPANSAAEKASDLNGDGAITDVDTKLLRELIVTLD